MTDKTYTEQQMLDAINWSGSLGPWHPTNDEAIAYLTTLRSTVALPPVAKVVVVVDHPAVALLRKFIYELGPLDADVSEIDIEVIKKDWDWLSKEALTLLAQLPGVEVRGV